MIKIVGLTDEQVLRYALAGMEAEGARIVARMSEIRAQLAGELTAPKPPIGGKAPAPAPGKRQLSPEAKARIQAGQKKRWAKKRREDKLKAKGRLALGDLAGQQEQA